MAVRRTLPVSESFWVDKKVNNDLTLEDKLLFLYFLTNEHVEQVGVYEASLRTIEYETAMDIDTIKKSIQNLIDADMIDYSYDTDEVAVLNYLKYSILKGGSPIEKCFQNLGKKVSDKRLLKKVYNKSILVGDDRDIYKYALNHIKDTLLSYSGVSTPITEPVTSEVKPTSVPLRKPESWERSEGEELVVVELENYTGCPYELYWVKTSDIANIECEIKKWAVEQDGETRDYKTFKEGQLDTIDKRHYEWNT